MLDALAAVSRTIRNLTRAPLFAAVAILTLALAIGANTAVFSVVDGVLLQPLPFEEPDALIGLWHAAPGLGFDHVNQSPALHFTYREEGRVFEDVGMWDNSQDTVTGLDEPQQVESMHVTASTFNILRLRPQIGRLFSEEDDTPDTAETVVLAYSYWQDAFEGDADVLGRVLRVNGRPREIIGVLPADVQFLDYDPAIYLPFRFDRAETFLGNFSYQGVARVKPGVTIEQVNADLDRMLPIAAEKFPRGLTLQNMQEARFAGNARPLKQDAVGDVDSVLWVLFGTVGLVLLIAVANVANLSLVRAESRQLEMAVRAALGAGRGTVAGEFLRESMLLALAGGAAGVALAWGAVRLLLRLEPSGLPRLDEIAVDSLSIAYALGLAALIGVVLGLAPALRYGGNLAGAIREGGRGGSAGRERHRARNALVVTQMALALVLLVGAGLMIRSLVALQSVEPGFRDPGEVLTFRVTIPTAEIADAEEVALAFRQIQEKLSALPGVDSVGASSSVTMDGWDSSDAVRVEGVELPEGQIPPIRRYKWVLPGYGETMGNTLLAGRTLDWADIESHADVVMVTETFAREYWSSPAAAIGKRVNNMDIEEGNIRWREIVGVVGNVHDDGVDQDATAVIYWPVIVDDLWGDGPMVQRQQAFVIRSARVGHSALLDEVRDAVWAVNASLPLARVRTLQEILDGSMARTSFTLVMLSIASAVALVLGAVGIYGVVSYVVTQRTREFGVRMALGAQRRDVTGMVLRQGLLLAAIGVAVGLLGAFGLTRLMDSLLYGVSAVDPFTYIVVSLVLTAVALLACWLPARRASRVDPVQALA